MQRPALFLALMVSTLLGPTLCCCATARLLASPASASEPAVQQESPTSPSCPFCLPEASPGLKPSPALPEPTHSGCPCCDIKVLLVYVAEALPAPMIPEVVALGNVLVIADPLAAFADASHMRAHPAGVGISAFLIDFCHRLRC